MMNTRHSLVRNIAATTLAFGVLSSAMALAAVGSGHETVQINTVADDKWDTVPAHPGSSFNREIS